MTIGPLVYEKNRLSLNVAGNKLLFTNYRIIFSVTNYFRNDSSASMDDFDLRQIKSQASP